MKKIKCRYCKWEWNDSDGGDDKYICHMCENNNSKFYLNESKNKLFIPRKLSKTDSRYDELNNSQPVIDGVRINQYDEDGIKQGYWENYYSNGNLLCKGNYKDDLRQGYWEWYYSNGNIHMKGSYKDDERDGYFEEYWKNGNLSSKGSYKGVNREGYWEFYHPNGNLWSRGNYKNGELVKELPLTESKNKLFIPRKQSGEDSKWVQWNKEQPIKDGKPINQYTEDGVKEGYWEHYYEDGNILSKGSYKDGKRDGYWEIYHNNGNLATKGNYKGGKYDDIWEDYDENGVIELRCKYKEDKLIKTLPLTESKNKLFIPRKLSKEDSRYDKWNKEQPVRYGKPINQYDEEGLKQGYWESYWDNGNIWSKGSYKDGKMEGNWKYYYEDGNIYSKGEYKNGKKEGIWEEYHSNGVLYSKGFYKNGKLIKRLPLTESKNKLFIPRKQSGSDSKWVEWNKEQPIKNINGKEIRINQYDEDGIKQGYWEEYWYNGNLDSKGEYKDGKRVGYWEGYHSNGNISSKGSYKDGKEDGYWEEYWYNGDLHSRGEYKDGIVDRIWEHYYDNGNIKSKKLYKNGKPIKRLPLTESKKLFIPRKQSGSDSKWAQWNKEQPIKDGKPINQYDIETGEKDGYWEEYHPNGKIESKGEYKDDKKDGYWKFYFENGNIESKGNYKKGMREGIWEIYWYDGDLYLKGEYKDGKREGMWEYYYEDGNIKSKKLYQNGIPIKKLPLTESKNKLFIPRKLSKRDSRYDEWNNSQPIKNINGKEIRINQYDEDGKKQGYWEDYYNNGNIWGKGYYKNDNANGLWKWYYPSGFLYLKAKYKDGELLKTLPLTESKNKLFIPRKQSGSDSKWAQWNKEQPIKDGKLINQYDEDGIKQGYWEDNWEENWYNGNLDSKGEYKDGKRVGYWEEYWNNGNLASKGSYKNGKKEGYWEFYFDDGVIMGKIEYKNGKIVK